MAIAKMCRAEFVVTRAEKLALLNYLQEAGVVSVEEDPALAEAMEAKKLISSRDAVHFKLHEYKVFADLMSTQRRPEDTAHLLSYTVSKKTLEELVVESLRWQQRLERGMKILAPYDEEKKPLFKQHRPIPLADRYMAYPEQAYIHERLIEVEEAQNEIERSEQHLAGMKTHLRNLEPWKDIELPRTNKLTYLSTAFGYFDKREEYDQFRSLIAAEEVHLASDIYFTSEEGALAVLLTWPKIEEEPVRRVLAASAFRNFPATTDVERKGDFVRAYGQQEKRIEYQEKKLAEKKEELKQCTEHIKNFEWLYDVLEADNAKLRALLKITNTNMLSGFTGFVPAALVPQLTQELVARFPVIMAFTAADPEKEDVPTYLVNAEPIEPIEEVINTFSPPSYTDDTDPAVVMMFTYAFFFGSMLSDIGYGLLLLTACLLGIYKFKAEGGMRQMMKVFAAGGAAAIVFGILYGSFFGDLLPALTNQAITLKPIWFDPMNEPINLMIWSVIFGVVHLFIGMAFDIKNKIRAGEWHDALFTVAPWYLIIVGAGLFAVKIPAGLPVLVAGAAVLFFLSPRGKNPFKRLISGLGALYNVTSWLSDLLSYTRILALTLATSVIAMVVNLMASMIGVKGPALIFTVIILIFGHALNLALSTLSAYVHATRLHYVEFFGHFYAGGGELFRPLRISGAYTRVSDAKPLSVRSAKK